MFSRDVFHVTEILYVSQYKVRLEKVIEPYTTTVNCLGVLAWPQENF